MPNPNKKVTGKVSSILDDVATAYYNQHPPEVYLAKDDKDSLHSSLMNFIPDDEHHDFGENYVWTGKLYEWNMNSDSLFVQQIVKNKLIRKFIIKSSTSGINSLGKSSIKTESFWSWLGDLVGSIGDFFNNLGYFLGLPFAKNVTWYSSNCGGSGLGCQNTWLEDAVGWFGDLFDGSGGGGSYGSGNGDGSIYNNYIPSNPGNGGWNDYPVHGGPNAGNNFNDYTYEKTVFNNSLNALITNLEDQLYIDFNFSYEQKVQLSEAIFDSHQAEILAHINELQNYTATGNDDNPFITYIRELLRRAMGIDQPKNATEAAETANEVNSWGIVGQFIQQLHGFWSTVFGFVPGYAAMDDFMLQKYGSGSINLSLDLFGGGLVGFVGHGIQEARAAIKVAEMADHYPAVYAILRKINISEIQIVKGTLPDKIIIIGENMRDRVLPFKAEFDKIFTPAMERFEMSQPAIDQLARLKNQLGRNLTLSELKTTQGFIENQNWIIEKINEGYNIIDIGSANPNQIKSAFYAMEKGFVFPH